MREGLRVAAVVVTHGRPQELQWVVAALQAQSRPPDTIIVFDNASPVAAADVLKQSAGAIEVLRSEMNLGGAGGFAAGLQYALDRGVEWVWLMDDDAVPEPEALAALLAALPGLPERTGALCSAVREYGALAVQHRRRFNRWIGTEHPVSMARYTDSWVEIDTGSFVGFLVSARAAREVGLPSEDFFLAYDDTDYSLRLREAGWRLWLVPASVVNHLRTAVSRLRSSRFGPKHYFNIRNRIVVKRRHAKFAAVGLVAAMGFGVLLWLATRGWRRPGSLRVLARAITDGIYGRLGAFPADLGTG